MSDQTRNVDSTSTPKESSSSYTIGGRRYSTVLYTIRLSYISCNKKTKEIGHRCTMAMLGGYSTCFRDRVRSMFLESGWSILVLYHITESDTMGHTLLLSRHGHSTRSRYEMGTYSAAHEEVTRLRRHDLHVPTTRTRSWSHERQTSSIFSTPYCCVARMLTWYEVDNRRMRR